MGAQLSPLLCPRRNYADQKEDPNMEEDTSLPVAEPDGNTISTIMEQIILLNEQNHKILACISGLEAQIQQNMRQGGTSTCDVQSVPCPWDGESPQEVLKSHLPELISDMDGLAVLPHLAQFFNKDELSRIEATADKHERNDRIIQGIWRHFLDPEENYPTCYDHLLKTLAGLHPDIFEKLQNRRPLPEEADFCMDRFVRELKKVILQQGHTRDKLEDEAIDLDRKYIQLELAVGQSDVPGNQSLLFGNDGQVPGYYQARLDRSISTDTTTPESSRLFPSHFPYMQRNLLTGRAGIGKSTTVQWMQRQWAKNIWGKEFTVVFLIPVRLLLTCDIRVSVDELLTKYTLYRTEEDLSGPLSTGWLRHNDRRMMLQVDGLDEIKAFSARMRDTPVITNLEERAHPLDLCINILRGNLLAGATLLCTSRHFLGLRNLEEMKRFEILGLSQEGVKTYIDRMFPDKSLEIKSVLLRNPVLMSICAITFYCTVICRLLHEDQSLSETDVMTYTRLQCFIMKKFASRNMQSNTLSLEGLSKLAELAYNGFFEVPSVDGCTQMVFTDEDLTAVSIGEKDLKMAINRGLLLCYDEHGTHDAKFEFLHLSVQELLSARFLLSKYLDDATFEKYLDMVPTDGRFDMVLLYLFGLCFDNNNNSPWVQKIFAALSESDCIRERNREYLKRALLRLIEVRSVWEILDEAQDVEEILDQIRQSSQSSTDKLRFCLMAYESQWPAIAECVMPIVIEEEKLEMEWCLVTAIDMMALIFTCRHVENLREISLKQANIDSTSTIILANYLTTNTTVTSLDLSCNQIKAEGLSALSDMLMVNTTLETFILDSNTIEDCDMEHLMAGLCGNESLKEVSLSDNCISDDTASTLAAHDQLFLRLALLKLDKNFITHVGANLLILKAGKSGTELSLLDLSNNFINVEKVMSGLEPKVRMNRGNVDYDHVLQKCKASKVIHLSNAGITDDDMKGVAKCIIGHEYVEEIHLENNQLTVLSLALLNTFGFTCPNLLRIHLAGNTIESRTVELLRDMRYRHDVEILTIRRGTEDLLMLGDWKHVMYVPFGMDTRWLNGLSLLLQRKPSLLELRFLSSRLKCLDSEVMADILGSSQGLTKLAITGISTKDWSLLSQAIHGMPHLTSLSIKDCQLSQEGTEEVLNLIPVLPGLTNFELSGLGTSQINLDTVSEVWENLKLNTSLVHLCLDDQPLGDTGAVQIATALRENKTLTTLALNSCQIATNGGRAIREALAMNSSLETLALRRNLLGMDLVQSLREVASTGKLTLKI